MKHFLMIFSLVLLFSSCKNELTFTEKTYEKKTTLPCKQPCPEVVVKIPFAEDVPIAADSINKKIFSVVREIIYFGEKKSIATDYDGVLTAFIKSYEDLQKQNPLDVFGWEAKVEGKVKYQTDSILNIELKHYSFTGGAHGYQGIRSLIFNPLTGKSIKNKDLFINVNSFKKFAEEQFRIKFKIPKNNPINSTGFMFENENFQLPMTFLFVENGILLYYNTYECASYAQGPQELLFTFEELKPYLKVK
jgi:hypothetical protein